MPWNANLLTCKASSNFLVACRKLASLQCFFVLIFVVKHKTNELKNSFGHV